MALSAGVPEDVVKAAFVYNAAKMSQWPAARFESPKATFNLCLLGYEDVDRDAFSELEGRSVGTHPLTVRRGVKLSRLDGCHVLYLQEQDEPRAFAALLALRSQPVLTIGAFDGFAENGGMISLLVENERLHIKINPGAILAAGLWMDGKLLRMGEVVRGEVP